MKQAVTVAYARSPVYRELILSHLSQPINTYCSISYCNKQRLQFSNPKKTLCLAVSTFLSVLSICICTIVLISVAWVFFYFLLCNTLANIQVSVSNALPSWDPVSTFAYILPVRPVASHTRNLSYSPQPLQFHHREAPLPALYNEASRTLSNHQFIVQFS